MGREPKRKHLVERYGYDQDGRLRVGEQLEDGRVVDSLIVEPLEDGCVRWHWYGDSLTRITRCTVHEGRLEHTQELHLRDRLTDWFQYDKEGRLVGVAFERLSDDYAVGAQWEGLGSGRQVLEYDEAGRLIGITELYENGDSGVLFLDVGKSWKELAPSLVSGLAVQIERAIAQSPDRDALALVALHYDEQGGCVPPFVVGATSADLAELREELPDPHMRMNPAEWPAEPLELELWGDVAKAARAGRALVDQQQAPGGAVRELAVAVAKRLDERLRETGSAVRVIAVDVEAEHLERNAKAILGEDAMTILDAI